VRFYLDEDLSAKIVAAARQLGVDVTASHPAGHDRLTDAEQLAIATADGRCLVTGNRDDFIRITNQWFLEQRAHAGVLIVPGSWQSSDYGRIARALASYDQIYGDRPTDFLFDFLR
jgi:hypothetical protein